MRITFLINDYESFVATQTTAMLVAAAVRLGHITQVVDVMSIGLSKDNEIVGQVRVAKSVGESTVADVVAQIQQADTVSHRLDQDDVFMLRTNPARDQERSWAYHTALTFARLLRERGVLVLNDPDGLAKASDKLYLSYVPELYRPRTLVTRDPQSIHQFLEEEQTTCVLKPLQGTRGKDVFFVSPHDTKNLNQIIDVLSRDGFIMAQEFLPDATKGDVRVVVMDGEILRSPKGQAAAIARVPKAGELRSNLHTGGRAENPTLTETMTRTVAVLGPRFRKDGIFLAGLDFIGGKLIEINVFSTGGFRDAERFTGYSFSEAVLQAIEAKSQDPVEEE